MICSAKAIANYFIKNYSFQGLTPTKLQELVYYSHGLHLGILDKPLVTDEFLQVSESGPVFPSLRSELNNSTTGDLIDGKLIPESHGSGDSTVYTIVAENDTLKKELLDTVWETYRDSDPKLTCEAGTPWAKTVCQEPGIHNATIKNSLVQEYFEEQIKNSKNQ